MSIEKTMDKTPEDEAFDELERRLNGFQYKRQSKQIKLSDDDIERIWGRFMIPYIRLIEKTHDIRSLP